MRIAAIAYGSNVFMEAHDFPLEPPPPGEMKDFHWRRANWAWHLTLDSETCPCWKRLRYDGYYGHFSGQALQISSAERPRFLLGGAHFIHQACPRRQADVPF